MNSTSFRAGLVPHNRKPLMRERTRVDGYIEISVPRRNPRTGHSSMYVLKHVWAWEQANGPLPKGYVLKCLDGNKANCDPSNWHAMPRGALARLNGGRYRSRPTYEEAPAELKPALLTLAELEQKAWELTR